jgi:hypothetical protein
MPADWFNEIWQRLRRMVSPKRLQRELEDEVAFHLAMRARNNRAAGLERCGAFSLAWLRPTRDL